MVHLSISAWLIYMIHFFFDGLFVCFFVVYLSGAVVFYESVSPSRPAVWIARKLQKVGCLLVRTPHSPREGSHFLVHLRSMVEG
jgi:hypothetical protein